MLSLAIGVVLAAAGPAGQAPAGRVVRPNAVVHSVADLDRSIAFYRDAVGLVLDPSPGFPSGSSRELGALTHAPGATLRAATLQVPGGDVRLTLVQISGVEARPVRPRLQDPGNVKLVVRVKDMDAAFARVRDRVGGVFTEGGAPIRPEGPAAVNRAVIMRDPDGYPLEFAFQGGPVAAGVPTDSNVIGGWATFIVGDVAATLEFYRDRLGFQAVSQPSALGPAVLSLQGTPTATGSMSAGVRPPGAAATWRMYDFRNVERARLAGRLQDPGTVAVSFLAENVPALLATLKAAGVTVVTDGGEPVNVNGRLSAFIRDPNGLLIELVEAGAQPAPRAQTASNPRLPPLFLTETWKQTGLERNVDGDVLSNPSLELHLYGPTSKQIQIAPTTPNTRQDPPNLWTGICTGPVAATLRDRNNYVDLDRPRPDPVADTHGRLPRRPSGPEARRRRLARRRPRRRRRLDRKLHRERILDRVGPLAAARHRHGDDDPCRTSEGA